MKFRVLRRKPPYTQEEISDQVGIVGMLMRQRDTAKQEEAIKRADTSVECAQEILNYMLQEVVEYGKK